MFQIVTAPRPNPRQHRPDLSPALLPIISKALSIEPKDRFASAEEFRVALLGWLETQGATTVYAPELHRWMTPTPSGEGAARAADPSGGAGRGRTPLHGPNPTPRPLDSTDLASETPLASSAMQKNAPRSRRLFAYLGAGAFVALLAAGGFGAVRGHLLGRHVLIAAPVGVAVASAPPAPNVPAPPPAVDTGGPKPSTAPAAAVRSGLVELTVKATPSFAKLFLDSVPLTGNPSVGQYGRDGQPHSLRVEAPRYVTKTTTVVFDERVRVVEVTLDRVPPPPPPPRPAVPKEAPSSSPTG
jgi:serine/threonine-protein kinase